MKIKLTFWKVIAAIILILGFYSIVTRFIYGLGSVTNLSDEFPWGLWIGFDILCGVGLAAGGFTLAAIVYIFNIQRFKPIVRPTILTAFLGYLLVIFALLIDLGRPWAIWHAIIMWNPNSVMFEVAWCVMLYTTVLFLEFSTVILEKFKFYKILKVIKAVMIPIVILGVILSTLHQSSLGSLYLIVPTKMHGLWYSSLLPVYFYISAIAAGCAMVIFESNFSAKAFNLKLEDHLLNELGRIIVVVLSVYFTLKFMDLLQSGKLGLLLTPSLESFLFWLEIILGVILPVILLVQKKIRENQKRLFYCASMVIAGFLLNRMNVSVTSLAAYNNVFYFPSFYEIMVTLFIVTFGVILFNYIAKNFNVFSEEAKVEEKIKYTVIKTSEI